MSSSSRRSQSLSSSSSSCESPRTIGKQLQLLLLSLLLLLISELNISKCKAETLNSSGSIPSPTTPPQVDAASSTMHFPAGMGPVLLNGCIRRNYNQRSYCSSSRTSSRASSRCKKLVEVADTVGSGFNGRGCYSAESVRSRLLRRVCSDDKNSEKLADMQTLRRINHADAVTQTFASTNDFVESLRHRAGQSSRAGVFACERAKLPALLPKNDFLDSGYDPSFVEPASATSRNDSTDGSSNSRSISPSKEQHQHQHQQSFVATMTVKVCLQQVRLRHVRPSDLRLRLLKEFMELPERRNQLGAGVSYRRFLQRWGSHYVRAATVGGQLHITRVMAGNAPRMTLEQFSHVAEQEFQLMFRSMQARTLQTMSLKQAYRSAIPDANFMKQEMVQFSSTSVDVQGGNPGAVQSLMKLYLPDLPRLFDAWLSTVPKYPASFDFQLADITDLLDIKVPDLFPIGDVDFGCGDSNKHRLKSEPATGRRYYVDFDKRKVYCDFTSIASFEKSYRRRWTSLGAAVEELLADEGEVGGGISLELPAGPVGCQQSSSSRLSASAQTSSARPLTYNELRSEPFLLAFDMPKDIDGWVEKSATFKVVFRQSTWYAVRPSAKTLHLYDGCQKHSISNRSICFRGVELTYNQKDGLFSTRTALQPLPTWTKQLSLARAVRLQSNSSSILAAAPCEVQWRNSLRLDPQRDTNCVRFFAASHGDVFVVFSDSARQSDRWLYLQLSSDTVSCYRGRRLVQRDRSRVGVISAPEQRLVRASFACLTTGSDSLTLQYGSAQSHEEIGEVQSTCIVPASTESSKPTFVAFGSADAPVSLSDVRLVSGSPKQECPSVDFVKIGGRCLPRCHPQCKGCKRPNSSFDCKRCLSVRLPVGDGVDSFQCVAECPAAWYRQGDSNECRKCPAGQHKPAVGDEACSKCPSGYFSKVGSFNCTACPTGFYSPSPGQYTCISCPAGHYANRTGSRICSPCQPGQYSEGNASSCSPCPMGHFSNSTGSANCSKCSSGYYASTRGRLSCDPCPPGATSKPGAASCDNLCKAGQYQSGAGDACVPCPAGHFSEGAGSRNCTACPIGTYQPAAGSSSCLKAPSGSYVDRLGARAVSECPPGTYNSLVGQESKSACVGCPNGTASSSNGSSSCTKCPNGQVPSESREKCQPDRVIEQKKCPKGTYSDNTADTNCPLCPFGHYSDTETAIACKKCPLGHHAGARGATSCNRCPPGTFASRLGSKFCTPCHIGYASARSGMAQCEKCRPGQFQRERGSFVCRACGRGTYSAEEGRQDCRKCSPGHIAPSTGSVMCQPCPAGTFASRAGASECYRCPLGTYSAKSGAAVCPPCEPGHYAAGSGQVSCQKCPPGKFLNSMGGQYADACRDCPAGTYSSTPASVNCTSCKPGKFSRPGATICIDCPKSPFDQHDPACFVQQKFTSCHMDTVHNNSSQWNCQHAMDSSRKALSISKAQYCSRTGNTGTNATWVGEFASRTPVRVIALWSRHDARNFESYSIDVSLLKGTDNIQHCKTINSQYMRLYIECSGEADAVIIRRRSPGHLTLCEVEAYS